MRFAGALLLPPLIAAAWLSIHLARADEEFRRATPESVEHAVALVPSNAEYAMLRAMQIEYDGGDSSALLEHTAQLHSMNAASRIRLGLAAEVRGDFKGAETWLLDAARVNRQFEPRWTLANFYFRRGDTEQFWTWMRAALDVSYGDRRPAFDLCWNASNDANEILTRAISPRRELLSPYLDYLDETHRAAAIPPVALKLAGFRAAEDRAPLLGSVDALIAANDAGSAKNLWSALGFSNPAIVFRGDFEGAEVGAGFDWHFREGRGITHLAIDQPRSMHRIMLNGSEAETTELLRQVVRLEPKARYKLTWQARTQGIATPTGIDWRIGDQHAPIVAHENGSGGELDFMATSDLVPLILTYSRPPGETRAEGSIELWQIAIVRD